METPRKKLSDALSTSKEFEEKIRRDYWLFGAPIKSSVTFTQGDLHYAIGSANYREEVLSCGNMLHITGVLSDIYDFTEIRSHDDPRFSWLSVEANNLGVNLQRGGHGFAYSYQVYFEMDIPLR